MVNYQFLDYVLLPVALLTEYRILSWPILVGCVAGLYYEHFSKRALWPNSRILMWRILYGTALVALVCVILLVLLSPKGPDYMRVVLGAISAVPLILPAVIGYWVRPRR
ncbi:MAG: hypothetical protein ACLGI6_03120 [Gammaproteobacteria bacterium]